MKKFFLVFLLLICSLKGTRTNGQGTPVIDASHILTSIVGFAGSLTEATTTTLQIIKQVELADSMAKMAKKGLDQLNKIQKEVQIAADIANMTTDFYNTTMNMERTLDKLKKTKQLTLPEMTEILDSYTSYLKAATFCINNITQLLKEESIVANHYERWKMIRKAKEELAKANARVEETLRGATAVANHRLAMDDLYTWIDNNGGGLSSIFGSSFVSFSLTNDLDADQEDMSYAAAVVVALENIEKDFGEDERQTEVQARQALRMQFEPYAKIFYAISAIMGLLAALRIYSKVNLGEPMDKLIVMFVGATILLILLPTFINMLFF
ncbi:MAG: DUF4134 domain-containing protein [Prevotellaceae bacterium]|jgi:PIN domain nuclease of toxin-antitoxin system|nr:DUF4134 domain-containing protein [Prevotellaceae bacterium]